MSSPIISIENLSKSYMVGHQSWKNESYTSLRDVLGRHAKNFVRKGMDLLRGNQIVQGDVVEEFWALRNVSVSIPEGVVTGIIGSNGAGKSTLLKVLSRITEPTSGKVILRGRVASLLEVGTGFHPELTGRENIFLNGSILGMNRNEIKRKFSEVVEFAGIENFIDTPVKRYSSGMYVRLAFAVAAHLEPEILIVDEVLAVGDSQFQAKCLGKMKEVASTGRTVLLVTHNLASVRALCDNCILLSKGSVKFEGSPQDAIQSYIASTTGASGSECVRFPVVSRDDAFTLYSASIESGGVTNPQNIECRFSFRINFQVICDKPFRDGRIGFWITDSDGIEVLDSYDCDWAETANRTYEGLSSITCEIPAFLLRPSRYSLTFNAGIPGLRNVLRSEGILHFSVIDTGGLTPHALGSRLGVIRPKLKWEVNGQH